ncbi:cadherin repeat domain-containing protein [Microvirga roseola]|uniref:hypothetical protein n=1 Tax=Microvirga roseola TaxID=2883126 RepID=UPI001E50B701|nr:hypothetical protein [Microvirga roseola]
MLFDVVPDEQEEGAFNLVVKSSNGFNHETRPQILVFLTADGDKGTKIGDPVTGEGMPEIIVDVTDVNEAPTGLTPVEAAIGEHAEIGDVVAALGAEDPDEGDTFTFTLVTSETDDTPLDHDLFRINGDEILVKAALGAEGSTHTL